jgi:hypothetical protein
MDNAVAIPLKHRARRRCRLRDQPSTASRRVRGIRRARGRPSWCGR